MKPICVALCVGAALTFGAGGIAVCADQREPAPLRAFELQATYELVGRVSVGDKVLRRFIPSVTYARNSTYLSVTPTGRSLPNHRSFVTPERGVSLAAARYAISVR
jgi:hypothetical protein